MVVFCHVVDCARGVGHRSGGRFHVNGLSLIGPYSVPRGYRGRLESLPPTRRWPERSALEHVSIIEGTNSQGAHLQGGTHPGKRCLLADQTDAAAVTDHQAQQLT